MGGGGAGPGERVPGEPPSHGRDSANVSGHAICAMLHGNQCAVLYDTEPTEIDVLEGVWLVITFDSLELQTFVFADFHSDY